MLDVRRAAAKLLWFFVVVMALGGLLALREGRFFADDYFFR